MNSESHGCVLEVALLNIFSSRQVALSYYPYVSLKDVGPLQPPSLAPNSTRPQNQISDLNSNC